MSYINCYSHITNQTLQCGLIEVGLKHKDTQANYGTTIQRAYQYWNTAPESYRNQTIIESNNKWQYGYSGSETVTFASITGRGTQTIGPTGELISNYGYIYDGVRQPISNGVFDIDDMNMGENFIDLFDTETVAIKLYCYKGKYSDMSSYNPSTPVRFFDAGGEEISEQVVLIDVGIRMYLKSNNNEICRYSFTQNSVTSVNPLKFSIATELFDIKQMVPSYYAKEQYDYRRNGYFDVNSYINNKIAGPDGEVTTPIEDAIIPAFELIMADGYTAPMQSNTYYRTTLIGEGLQPISNATLREIANELFSGFVLFEASTYPNDFIQFVSPQGNYGLLNYSTRLEYYTNEVYNQDHGYRYRKNGEFIEDLSIQGNVKFDISGEMMLASPLLLPLTTNNYEYMTYDQAGLFIPLTGVINGGEPEPPEPEPGGDEEADDPETSYTPEQSDGYETPSYENSDVVSGEVPMQYQSSYTNWVFSKFKLANFNDVSGIRYDRYTAYSMIMDCANVSVLEWFASYLKAGNVNLNDIITRVYETPFSYNDIIGLYDPGVISAAPTYSYFGIITMETIRDSHGDWTGNPLNPHWYNMTPYRFYNLDLGTITIQKAFENYLDYESRYILHLPYGAGEVEIDPNYLFRDDSNYGYIRLKGIFDIDCGTLVIKVITLKALTEDTDPQIYYQTTINVACDKVISGYNESLGAFNLAKVGLALSTALTAGAVKSGVMTAGLGVQQAYKTMDAELETYRQMAGEAGLDVSPLIEQIKANKPDPALVHRYLSSAMSALGRESTTELLRKTRKKRFSGVDAGIKNSPSINKPTGNATQAQQVVNNQTIDDDFTGTMTEEALFL